MNSQSALLNNMINNDSFLPLLQKFYSLETIGIIKTWLADNWIIFCKFYLAKEKWSDDVTLYVGQNRNQMLFESGNGAETLATLLFLEELHIKFNIKFVKNVNDMSPSGFINLKSLFQFQQIIFKIKRKRTIIEMRKILSWRIRTYN